ncbi:hypothetical protein CPC08DRAFT_824646 [Agrocybe pediades]|nr:hypothetical protein CPC08DRAFT_824646 [Agrocybe pediades]
MEKMQPTPPCSSDNPAQYDPKTPDTPSNTRFAEEAEVRAFFRDYNKNEISKITTGLTTYYKEMISTCQGKVDSINALALVISFVAGIQVTIITLSIATKDTALERTINAVAFIGLTVKCGLHASSWCWS